MTDWVTLAELEDAVGVDDFDDATGDAALASAKAIIQAEVRQLIDWVEDDEVILDGHGTRVIQLPELPVAEVTSVSLWDGTDWATPLVESVDYHWSATGTLTRTGWLAWPCASRSVQVVYSHGYECVPADLKAWALSIARNVYVSPSGARGARGAVVAETVGPFSVRYAEGSAGSVGAAGGYVGGADMSAVRSRYRLVVHA